MFKKNESIGKLLSQEEIGPVFFITPNPIYAIGLEKIIKNYFVICSQKHDIIRYLRKEKIPVLSLNNNNIKTAGKILISEKVIKYINENSSNKKANIITFKPSPMIQKVCDDNDFNYLGNDWKLSNKLENKIEFTEVTRKLKIPNADSRVIRLDRNSSSLNFSKNNKFVIQLPRGHSGNSTFLIKSNVDFENLAKKYEGRNVKVSKYFEGETYTINACVVGSNTLLSGLIFQITGFSLYNKNSFGGTCGNDYVYPKKLIKEQRRKIFNYSTKVGDYINGLGYKGIFGLDFVVSDGRVDLIEINPRIVGSMSLFTKLQIQNHQTSFLLLGILEFMIPVDVESENFDQWNRKIDFDASQLILRNTRSKPIEIVKSLKSGIYEIKNHKLIFKNEIYCVEKKLGKGEYFVQCSPTGRIVSPDLEYANIQFGHGIIKCSNIKKEDELIINKVLNSIKIK